MFLSMTDNTIVFAFEDSVAGKQGDKCVIKKDDNTGTRSIYTQSTSSTDSLQGIRIRHSVTFNAVGNVVSLYATVYSLSEDELPTVYYPTGKLSVPLPEFCYGGCQDASNDTIGHLVLLRSTSKEDGISTDQQNHIKYRNEIFLPFLEKKEKVISGGKDLKLDMRYI